MPASSQRLLEPPSSTGLAKRVGKMMMLRSVSKSVRHALGDAVVFKSELKLVLGGADEEGWKDGKMEDQLLSKRWFDSQFFGSAFRTDGHFISVFSRVSTVHCDRGKQASRQASKPALAKQAAPHSKFSAEMAQSVNHTQPSLKTGVDGRIASRHLTNAHLQQRPSCSSIVTRDRHTYDAVGQVSVLKLRNANWRATATETRQMIVRAHRL